MDKLKKIFSSPKKTAMLGLISSIVISLFLINSLFYNGIGIIYTFLYDINTWGFIVYFSIVVMRLYKQKGNIKLANYILILFIIIYLLYTIHTCRFIVIYDEISFYHLMNKILTIFMTFIDIAYLFNILFKKAKIKYITNKLFAITNILFAIYFTFFPEFNLLTLIYYVAYLLKIPYFYNYYELLKGEKNGK